MKAQQKRQRGRRRRRRAAEKLADRLAAVRVRELPARCVPMREDTIATGDSDADADHKRRLDRLRVFCVCNWRGVVGDLRVDPDWRKSAADDQEPYYCPDCHRNGWEGWEYA